MGLLDHCGRSGQPSAGKLGRLVEVDTVAPPLPVCARRDLGRWKGASCPKTMVAGGPFPLSGSNRQTGSDRDLGPTRRGDPGDALDSCLFVESWRI